MNFRVFSAAGGVCLINPPQADYKVQKKHYMVPKNASIAAAGYTISRD